VGIDYSLEAVEISRQYLDRVERIDLNNLRDDSFIDLGHFDAIVIGDLLEHLTDAESVLKRLHRLTNGTANIYCCLPNMSHVTVIERFLSGDFTYDDMGLLDRTHLRLFSPSSAYKTFLDAGWIPDLVGSHVSDHVEDAFFKSLLGTIAHLGVPEKTARKNLGIYQMILQCRATPPGPAPSLDPQPRVAVIVPVTRRWEFDLNVVRSPGLKEINAQIIIVHGASSAAEAYGAACNNLDCDWILFLHQDVYVPKGAGTQLVTALGELGRKGIGDVPVGFAGLAQEADAGVRPAGLVVDRTALFSHPGSQCGISLDEFAVLLKKNSQLKIDAALGWHTWATDLCIQTMNTDPLGGAVILEVPMFHNSLNDYSLPAPYHQSAKVLLEKYPQLPQIPTLCGVLKR
jgi:SAM-dependent methyltransferase